MKKTFKIIPKSLESKLILDLETKDYPFSMSKRFTAPNHPLLKDPPT